jgi:large subunit ribosomal protein L10
MSKLQLFNGMTQKARAVEAFKNAKKSMRGNQIPLRKTFLFQVYKDVVPARAIFVLQNNNMTSNAIQDLKRECRKSGFSVLLVRNSIFGAAVSDIEPSANTFRNLLVGPSILVYSNASDGESPNLLKDFNKIALKFKAKTMVAGAKYDGIVLSADALESITKLPNLLQLQSQLVGLLSSPAQQLVHTLGFLPSKLGQILNRHLKNIEK